MFILGLIKIINKGAVSLVDKSPPDFSRSGQFSVIRMQCLKKDGEALYPDILREAPANPAYFLAYKLIDLASL